MPLKISRLRLQNWKNFPKTEESGLSDISFILGANASGKSNYLDALRFLRDIAKSRGGGLQDAIEKRGGLKSIRCLHARSVTEVTIEVDISDGGELIWTYLVSFGLTGSGLREPELKSELVIRYEKGGEAKRILSRPTSDDLEDRERLRETHLEQTSANFEFREVSEFFASVSYVHLVPQLLKYGDQIGGTTLEEDPFGQEFMLRISRTAKRRREARLRRIERALQTIVPQIEDLTFIHDAVTGLPHLEVRFRHHRPRGALQREDQLSDGTLRLIALLWLLQEDGGGPLLLEEPELSLNEEIVRQIPEVIAKIHRQSGSQRQVFVSTHSYALLSNPGIGSNDLILIIPSLEGSTTRRPSSEEAAAMQAGLSPADVVLPAVRPSPESMQFVLKF
jgi:predicted ATPase